MDLIIPQITEEQRKYIVQIQADKLFFIEMCVDGPNNRILWSKINTARGIQWRMYD